MALDPESGSYCEDVMDFWRPNYRDEACVDGKYSIKVYLNALTESWEQYQRESGRSFDEFDHFCYHLPFTRMAEKAHRHLARINGHSDLSDAGLARHIGDALPYSRTTGNAYTASLYVGLASLLDLSEDDLGGRRVGFFSYGSGCMGSFFSGTVTPGYRAHLRTDEHRRMLADRVELSFEDYVSFYRHRLPTDGREYRTEKHETGGFRIAGVSDHKRLYEKCAAAADRQAHTPDVAAVGA
jgi:hydroxymethylglutaryl-CoA synthase